MTRYKQLAAKYFAIGEGVAASFDALGLTWLHVTDALFGMYDDMRHHLPDDWTSCPNEWAAHARSTGNLGFHALAGAQAYYNRSLGAKGEAPPKHGEPRRNWIYLVSQSHYEGLANLGVFSCLQRAEDYAEAVDRVEGGSVDITELGVDTVQPPTKGEWFAELSREGEIIDIEAQPVRTWRGGASYLRQKGANYLCAHIVAANESEARQVVARLVERACADPTLSGRDWAVYD